MVVRAPVAKGGGTCIMIRTPDQRVRVFVSPTLEELAAERQAVTAAITQLRLTPVLFELGERPYPAPRSVSRLPGAKRRFHRNLRRVLRVDCPRHGSFGPGGRVPAVGGQAAADLYEEGIAAGA